MTRPRIRANHPILIPSVPVSEGIEIRHGCQFISGLVLALAKLPGGLCRFLPGGIGSHMSRFRHLGWNQCSHGLKTRPLESSHYQCLNAVFQVLEYPKGAAAELSDGTLKLRHCTTFYDAFSPMVFAQESGMVVVKDGMLLLVMCLMIGVTLLKGSG